MRHYRVLLCGDSIRCQYQPRVAELLAAEEGILIETVGPDDSTGSSADLMERIESLLDTYQPDAIHFNAGLEDVKWIRAEHHNVVPMTDYEMNLQHIIDACRPKLGGDVIFATTTPVIDEKQSDQPETAFDLFNREIAEYNVAAQQIMLLSNVLINHLDRVIAERDDECLAGDGVSLTETGVELAARATADCIRSLWH